MHYFQEIMKNSEVMSLHDKKIGECIANFFYCSKLKIKTEFYE